MQNVDVKAGAGTGVLPAPSDQDEVDLVPVRTYWTLVRQRFVRHQLAVIGAITLALIVIVATVIPLWTGDAYQKSSLQLINAGPTLSAPLGYDDIGPQHLPAPDQGDPDIADHRLPGRPDHRRHRRVRRVRGRATSAAGSTTSSCGSSTWSSACRTCSSMLMIVSFFGIRDIRVIVFAIAFAGWTTAARLVRAEFLHLREMDFVAAAKALGAPSRRIIVRHMMPGAMAPLVVACSLGRRRRDHRRVRPVVPRVRDRATADQPRPDAAGLTGILLRTTRSGSSIRALCWSPSSCVRASSATACATPSTRASESRVDRDHGDSADAHRAKAGDNLLEIQRAQDALLHPGRDRQGGRRRHFEIKYGQTLGVVGESGCGKSVTALSVMRLIGAAGRRSRGEILLDGRDLSTLATTRCARSGATQISMIFQEPMTSLNPVFTVGDQIAEAVALHQKVAAGRGLGPRDRDARAGRHPRRQAACQGVPAPAVGRHAPARDDRDGARRPTRSCSSPTSRRPRWT